MSRVHLTTKIKAPVDRVWKTVMNPDCLEDWVTIHRSVEAVSSGPLHEGSTMDQVLCLRGVSFDVHWTLVEVNPPTHAEWVGEGPAHSHARIRYELTADGDGATQVEYMTEFTTPGGPLGTVASRVIVGAASEREAKKSLRRLKVLLEHLTSTTGGTGCRMAEQAHGQHLAETLLPMINTHDPGLLDRFVAEDYLEHNAPATDGPEATVGSGPRCSRPSRISAAVCTKRPTTRRREMTGRSIGYVAAPSAPGGSSAPLSKASSPPSTTRS